MNKIINGIKKAWKNYRAKQKQQQQEQQAQQQHQYLINLMYAIANDLYVAFQGRTYAGLANITAPQDIRLHNYRYVNNGFLFQYRIAKRVPEQHLIALTLNGIKNNMNADIASAQQNLIYQYGFLYVSQMYPFLYNGIYVLAVQDFGGSDVIITVVINNIMTSTGICTLKR
jgi:hypothetical protein